MLLPLDDPLLKLLSLSLPELEELLPDPLEDDEDEYDLQVQCQYLL